MVLRDFYCMKCGHILCDVERDTAHFTKRCSQCGTMASHQVLCNGGLKSRARVNDFPSHPSWWRGQVKTLDVDACHHEGTPDETPVARPDGSAIVSDPDKRELKRERAYHGILKNRGLERLYCDCGRK